MRSPLIERSDGEQTLPNPLVDSLDGKRVGLVDNGKKAAEPVLDVIAERLEAEYDVEVVRYTVAELNMLKDPEELVSISKWAAVETDVCIGAIGDCGSCTKFLARAVNAVERAEVTAVGLLVEGFELDYEMNAKDLGRDLRYCVIPVRSETTDRERIQAEMASEDLRAIVNEMSELTSTATAGE